MVQIFLFRWSYKDRASPRNHSALFSGQFLASEIHAFLIKEVTKRVKKIDVFLFICEWKSLCGSNYNSYTFFFEYTVFESSWWFGFILDLYFSKTITPIYTICPPPEGARWRQIWSVSKTSSEIPPLGDKNLTVFENQYWSYKFTILEIELL